MNKTAVEVTSVVLGGLIILILLSPVFYIAYVVMPMGVLAQLKNQNPLRLVGTLFCIMCLRLSDEIGLKSSLIRYFGGEPIETQNSNQKGIYIFFWFIVVLYGTTFALELHKVFLNK